MRYALSRSRVCAGTVECVMCCLGPDPKPELHGDNRTYRVWLDPNQYQMDMTQTVKGVEVRLVLPLLGICFSLFCSWSASSFHLHLHCLLLLFLSLLLLFLLHCHLLFWFFVSSTFSYLSTFVQAFSW